MPRCNEIILYHITYHMGYKLSQMEITTNLVNYNLLHVKFFVQIYYHMYRRKNEELLENLYLKLLGYKH